MYLPQLMRILVSMSAGLKKILPTKQKNTQCNFASKKHILLPNQHSLRNGFYRKKNRSIILTLCKNGEQSDNTWHSQDSENHRINPRTPNSKLNKTFIKKVLTNRYNALTGPSLFAWEPRCVATSAMFSLLHLSFLQTSFQKIILGNSTQLTLPPSTTILISSLQ